jgi:hypothetical protein
MFITVQSSREEFLKLSKTLNESSEIKIPLVLQSLAREENPLTLQWVLRETLSRSLVVEHQTIIDQVEP